MRDASWLPVDAVTGLWWPWLAQTTQPILLGPWTSEMGFEALYWLPYLQQLRHRYHLDPQRLIAVTRGGAGAWYDVPRTVELYDYLPAKDLRLSALQAQAADGSIKQRGMTAWERRLLALLAERLGLRRYYVLHPSWMYQALEPWWGPQTMPFSAAIEQLRFTPIPAVPVPVGLSLPEQYVVVRWYQRATWPLREDLVDWTQAVVRVLAERMPVVVLQSSTYADDHVDFPVLTGPNITLVRADPWRDNLAVQSAVLQRAAAFVGTWGGVAQLAVRLGIATAAFFDRWHSCSYAHKVLTEWLALQQGTGLFVGRPHDAEFVRTVLSKELALPALPKGSSS